MKTEKQLQGEVAQIKFTHPHGSRGLDIKNADSSNTEGVLTLNSATALMPEGRVIQISAETERRNEQGG